MNIPQKWINIFGLLIIVLLAADVVLLTLKTRKLEKELANSSQIAQVEPLTPGEIVGGFSVEALDGTPTNISYSDPDASYLLFVLSTTCPHCLANIVKWKSITERVGEGVYVVGVSLHDVEKTLTYMSDKDVPFYTVCATDAQFQENYKISGVPSTILISGRGVVRNTWVGELNDDQVDEIISTVHQNTARFTN